MVCLYYSVNNVCLQEVVGRLLAIAVEVPNPAVPMGFYSESASQCAPPSSRSADSWPFS